MFNYCFNLQSHDRKGVVTKIEYRLSNSLMNQFLSAVISTKAETYLLINQFTSSPINSLHRARKNNLFMQNEPNLKQLYEFITAYTTSTYKIYVFKYTLKNEPKRTQNEPNFSSKLASFSPKLALNQCKSAKSAIKQLVYFRVNSWLKSSVPKSLICDNPRNLRLNNKYFYFICCIFRLLCYNIAKWRFNLSSLKSKPPIKNSVRDNIIIGL